MLGHSSIKSYRLALVCTLSLNAPFLRKRESRNLGFIGRRSEELSLKGRVSETRNWALRGWVINLPNITNRQAPISAVQWMDWTGRWDVYLRQAVKGQGASIVARVSQSTPPSDVARFLSFIYLVKEFLRSLSSIIRLALS